MVWLELATLLYLGSPVLVWTCSWLKPACGFPTALLLLISMVLAWRETRRHYRTASELPGLSDIPLIPWIGAVLLACLWAVYSGAGGFTYFNGDWIKHFAFLRDLTQYEWPVAYATGETASPLVYYVAYYLPAALVGKVWGWWWANFAIMLWTCLGASLAASWFIVLAGRLPLVAGACFIVANGLDFIGDRILSGLPMQPGNVHLDWWAGFTFLNFPGHTSQLTWAPQHSFAAWMATGLLAVQLADRRGLGHSVLLIALSSLWSPFTVLGLVPFGLVAFFRERGRGLFTASNLLSLPALLCVVLFLSSKANDLPSGPLWSSHDLRIEWPRLLLFYLLECVVFFLFCRELRRSRQPGLRWLFWTAGATLLVVPLYKLGDYNDWCMRVSIPALFLMWAGVARSFVALRWHPDTRVLLILFVVGSFGSFQEIARAWGRIGFPPNIEYCSHVPELQANVARQYVANPSSFFHKHLARTGATPAKLDAPFAPLSPREPLWLYR